MNAERSAGVRLSSFVAAQRGAGAPGVIAALRRSTIGHAVDRALCRAAAQTIHDGCNAWPEFDSQISIPIDRRDRPARLSLLSEVGAIGRHMMGSEG